jgi:synaptobrevin family protein YKT6
MFRPIEGSTSEERGQTNKRKLVSCHLSSSLLFSLMKLLCISLYRWVSSESAPVLLCRVEDLSSFGYFTRSTISEHLKFAGRTVVGRTPEGTRQTVGLKDNPFVVHSYVRPDGLSGCVISDVEYPQRVAFSLLNKLFLDFDQARDLPSDWRQATEDWQYDRETLAEELIKYQNPSEADKLLKITKELDDIKEIMHSNIEEVLKRGETLDSLMERSQDLSSTSVTFYKKAKQQNQCCKMY